MLWRVEYTYDVFDHLVERGEFLGNSSTPSKTEAFVWDGWNIALVLDGAGGVSQRYFTGEAADQIFASENALGEVLWSLTDHLNTPRDFLDSAGTLQNHRVFDSFGRLVSETNAAATAEFSFFFTGGYRDPLTALDLRWHRWYDSQVGRWLSEDWIEDDLQNSYRYGRNASVMVADPMGMAIGDYFQFNVAGAFIGSIGGNIYDSGKALFTGEAGTCIGNRAVAITENATGRPFEGGFVDSAQFTLNGAREVFGSNATAEAIGGYDLATNDAVTGQDRLMRAVGGATSMAGWAAGGLTAAAKVAPGSIAGRAAGASLPGSAAVARAGAGIASAAAPASRAVANAAAAIRSRIPAPVAALGSRALAVLNYDIGAALQKALRWAFGKRSKCPAPVNAGVTAVFKDGFYEVNGFKFSKYYYEKLWRTGRGAPSLVAKEVLEGAGQGVADAVKPGFFKYVHGGWELVYNPVTKEVWHLQPIKP